MRARILIIALVCALAPLAGRAQTAVTGNLKDVGVANASGSNTYVRFTLIDYGAQIPKITNPTGNVIFSPIKDFKPDVNGNISGTIQGNDTISPPGTKYQVCIYYQGQQFRCNTYFVNGGAFNLNTATPLNSSVQAGANQLVVLSFPFTQATPASTWTIPHNFNDPNAYVQVFDSTHKIIYPDSVNTSDPNNAVLTFVTPTAGFAIAMHAGAINIATNQPNAVISNSVSPQTFGSQIINFTGPLAAVNVNNALHVGGPLAASIWGTDIGTQINTAYSFLPASGGVIVVDGQTSGACYDYSTPVVANVSGKYLLLEGGNASGATGVATMGGVCLNYLPASGAAITLDYVTNASSNLSSAHGLRNITIRNNCQGTGCFTGSATGIAIGTTNSGILGASMENVSVIGFPVGFSDPNNNSVQIAWYNPQFFSNGVAFKLKSITGFWLFGGQLAGNATGIAAFDSTSTPELNIYGTSFFSNTSLSIDFTALGASTYAALDCFACHFETTGASSHSISGQIDLYLSGGVMEDDTPSVTRDWMITSNAQRLIIDGTRFATGAGSTITQIAVVNSPVRGWMKGFIISAGHFTNYVTGPNTSRMTIEMMAGNGVVASTPFIYESQIQAPSLVLGGGSSLATTNQTGTGSLVLATSPTLSAPTVTNPTVTTGSFSNPAVTTGTFSSPALTTPTIGGGNAINSYFVNNITPTFTAISAQTCQEQPGTVTGAAVGAIAYVSPLSTVGNTNLSWSGWVSATNTVNVRVCNPSSGSITPSAVTWRVAVMQ